ncbi:MAG: hypothetical protein IAF02_18645 [Anaerolineae bacterium]|nr:hypothetical protein [Anaerolineae bacterium]
MWRGVFGGNGRSRLGAVVRKEVGVTAVLFGTWTGGRNGSWLLIDL